MMEPTTIDPATPVTVTFQWQMWSAILAVLLDAPYRIAAPAIKGITEQAQAAALPDPYLASAKNGQERAHVQD
jgi:hypothetical protein